MSLNDRGQTLGEILAKAGIILEVLSGQISLKPYQEMTPELQSEIQRATLEVREAIPRASQLERDLDELRQVCGWAYQFAGTYDAPVEVLDNLSCAANGDPIPHELKPIDYPEVKAANERLTARVAELEALLASQAHKHVAYSTAYSTAQQIPAIDFGHPIDSVPIAAWRKHPKLHGWMEQLYRRKHGKEECFNCATVQLDAADLVELEHLVQNDQLPNTDGFFFGESRPEDKVDDLKFIAKAMAAIEHGFKVFYASWW